MPEIMYGGAPEVYPPPVKAGKSPYKLILQYWCDVKPNKNEFKKARGNSSRNNTHFMVFYYFSWFALIREQKPLP